MSELRSVVAEFAAVDVRELPDAAVTDELQAIRRVINMLEAQFERRLDVFDRRAVAEQDCGLGTASWLTRFCKLDPADARARVTLARRLSELPAVQALFEQGDIALGHARVIGTAVADVPAEQKEWAEQVLTGAAPHVEPLALDVLSRRLRYEVDPESADERAKRQYEGRRLSVASTFGGMVSVNGILDPVAGATVQTALNAFMAPIAGDDRTMPQKRADALVEICQRMLRTSQPPTNGGSRPQLLMRATVNETADGIGGLSIAQPGDLSGVGPLARTDLARLSCDAQLIRVLFNGRSELLDLGRATRTFPPAIRKALLAQWKTCFWEGCNSPAEWSEGHHIVHWSQGGETSEANGCLPCTRHHHVIHDQDWQLEKLPDGTIVARRGAREMVCKPNAP